MTNIPDIDKRITADFGAEANEVFELVQALTSAGRHLNDPRLIRCIIYLADKNLVKLKVLMESAASDARDIFMWAEYVQSGPGDETKRVRDFSKSFEESEMDVRE